MNRAVHRIRAAGVQPAGARSVVYATATETRWWRRRAKACRIWVWGWGAVVTRRERIASSKPTRARDEHFSGRWRADQERAITFDSDGSVQQRFLSDRKRLLHTRQRCGRQRWRGGGGAAGPQNLGDRLEKQDRDRKIQRLRKRSEVTTQLRARDVGKWRGNAAQRAAGQERSSMGDGLKRRTSRSDEH